MTPPRAAQLVKHIVMFGLKDTAEASQIATVRQGLLALPQHIPTIVSYELGMDLGLPSGQSHPAGKNRSIAWSCCFRSVEDYEAYAVHEQHKAVLADIAKIIEPGTRAAIQYETSTP